MKTRFWLFLLLLTLLACENKQYVWDKEIGISRNGYINKSIETKRGHFILIGKTLLADHIDAGLAIRLSPKGDEIWKRVFKGGFEFKDVVELDKGELLILASQKGKVDGIRLFKLDGAGNLLWQKKIEISNSAMPEAFIKVEDGFIITGAIQNTKQQEKALIIKVSEQGKVLWSKVLGKGLLAHFYTLAKLKDGFVVAGRLQEENLQSKAWVVKFSLQGDKVWEHFLKVGDFQSVYSLIPTYQGDIALAGMFYNLETGSDDLLFYILDSQGRLKRKGLFGGLKSEKVFSLVQSKEGVFYLGGYTWNYKNNSYDLWLLALNQEGKFMWDKSFGSDKFESITSLLLPKRGGILLTSFRENKNRQTIWTAKLNKHGEPIVEKEPSYLTYVQNYFASSLYVLTSPIRNMF